MIMNVTAVIWKDMTAVTFCLFIAVIVFMHEQSFPMTERNQL